MMMPICETGRVKLRCVAIPGCQAGTNACPARGGLTLLEVTVASAILMVILSASIEMLRAVAGQQRAAERHAIAMQAVQAISEQIGNIPWEQLTTEAAAKVAMPAPLERHLPAAKLLVVVEDQAEPVAAKRIRVELTRSGPGDTPAAPVRLTSWVYPEP
jgi:hypothetical protein